MSAHVDPVGDASAAAAAAVAALGHPTYALGEAYAGGGVWEGVHRGSFTAPPGDAVAVKIVRKAEVVASGAAAKGRLQREIAILTQLRHPNLINLVDVVCHDAATLLIVTEPLDGRCLKEVIPMRPKGNAAGSPDAVYGLPEPVARQYFQDVVVALQYVHARGVVHRDLKPDNVLVVEAPASPGGGARRCCKLTDFALANFQRRTDGGDVPIEYHLRTRCGTPFYIAPEVVAQKEGYSGYTADVWSLGILLYVMLVGCVPFTGSDAPSLFKNILKGTYAYPQDVDKKISTGAKTLLRDILQTKPARRISITGIAAHEWFRKSAFDKARLCGRGVTEGGLVDPKYKEYVDRVHAWVAGTAVGEGSPPASPPGPMRPARHAVSSADTASAAYSTEGSPVPDRSSRASSRNGSPPPRPIQLDLETAKKQITRDSAKYTLGRMLGKGAYGVVVKGTDRTTGKNVAVKRIARAMLRKDGAKGEQRLYKEIAILGSLRHPNLVNLLEVVYNEAGEEMWMVLELVVGCELLEKIRSDKRLTEVTARDYFRQLVVAVHYVHSQGVVHRDLKPENVLLTPQGVCKITDFGLCNIQETNTLGEVPLDLNLRTRCGTPYYIAPEVVTQKEGYSGFGSDVWSLGIMLYFMLVGELPFIAKEPRALFKMIARGSYSFPTQTRLSNPAKDLIASILVPKVENRIGLTDVARHPWFIHGGFDATLMAVPEPVAADNITQLADVMTGWTKTPPAPAAAPAATGVAGDAQPTAAAAAASDIPATTATAAAAGSVAFGRKGGAQNRAMFMEMTKNMRRTSNDAE